MIAAVTLRPRARLDLLEQFVYFGEQESVELADRYLAAVEATCLRLAVHPLIGVVYDSGIARLNSMRRIPVMRFENYLVFYLARQAGIDVIRVLHGARDIDSVLAQEEG